MCCCAGSYSGQQVTEQVTAILFMS
jgi:hypothetical protein